MDKKENKTTKKRRNNKIVIVIILLVVLLGIVVLFLNQGSTTTTGQYPEDVKSESLTCTKDNINYPFFAYDNATKKTAKIDIVFNQDKMKSIALTYSLYYNDSNSITASEAHNHAAMNESFATAGLDKADAYNAKYARMNDRMQMNLYATASDFDTITAKYFWLNGDALPQTLANYQQVYQEQGFNCQIVNN